MILRSRIAFVAVVLGLGNLAVSQSFTGIGGLPNRPQSFAYDISADGTVVAAEHKTAQESEGQPGFWTRSTGIVDLGLGTGRPYGVSADGTALVGYYRRPGVITAVRSQGGQTTNLASWSYALAANLDGSVVVGATFLGGGTSEAFRWTESTGRVGLGFLPGATGSYALDVSADGSVTVGSSGSRAVRWTPGGIEALGQGNATALSVSPDGLTVIGWSETSNGDRGWRWTAGTGMVELFSGQAADSSDDCSIIVGRIAGQEALIWDEVNGVRNIEDVLLGLGVNEVQGWRLVADWIGCSADGRVIAGTGYNPSGRTEGWVAEIPEVQRPDGFEVIRGSLLSGGLSDLFSSDNMRLDVQQRPPLLASDPSVQVVLNGTAPTGSAAGLFFRLETNSNGFPSIAVRQRIELRDFQANAWEIVDERNATVSDSIVDVSITSNASRFIQAGTNRLQARINWFDRGVALANWSGRIDLAFWRLD